MVLKRNGVAGKSKPTYPDVGEFRQDRRGFLLKLAGGVLGVTLLGLESCRTPGEPVVVPAQPKPEPDPIEPEIMGKVAPPVAPPEPPPLPGEPMVPPTPVPTPPDPTVIHMKGDMAEPPLPVDPSKEKDVVEEVEEEVDPKTLRTGGVAPNIEPINMPGEAPVIEPEGK